MNNFDQGRLCSKVNRCNGGHARQLSVATSPNVWQIFLLKLRLVGVCWFMKLFATFGPGDIVRAHRAQISGGKILSETSIIFSGQLFEYCRERGIETLALSRHTRVDTLTDGLLQLENRPRMFEGAGGIRYHISQIAYAFCLAVRARRFGADLAVINSGSGHYFALTFIRVLGIPVAINFHSALWPNGFEPKRWLARLIRSLDGWFFRHVAAGAIGVSPILKKQVQQLARRELPFFEYRAQFRSEGFQPGRIDDDRNPFRVIFVGRAERNKGVLDIAVMAEQLRRQSSIPILFEVCGDGSALPLLKRIVEEKSLETVRIHGKLARPELLEVYARAHAVIVPTRSDLPEGFAMVCAEAILSGLPVITSSVVPALEVLRPACVEARTDDVDSYVEAILKLAQDHAFYDRLSSACADLARQFLDRSQSYPAAMDRLIAHLFAAWEPLDDYEPLFARVA